MTRKQAQFVREYLIDLNATQAAVRAGYSAKTARQIGEENLSKPDIAKAMQTAMAERSKRTEVTADLVLRELALIAFADIRRIFGPDGAMRPPHELDDDTARALQSIEVVTRQLPGEARRIEEVHKLKLGDKIAALTLLGRHLAMWKDRVEVTLPADTAALLQAASLRVGG